MGAGNEWRLRARRSPAHAGEIEQETSQAALVGDTHVSNYWFKANSNYGNRGYLATRDSWLEDINAGVQFVVPDVEVTSATLRLKRKSGTGKAGDIYSAETGWDEMSVTWNSGAPSTIGARIASLGNGTPGTWVEIDVTEAVRRHTDPNGLVAFAVMGKSSDVVECFSRESANDPQLVIEHPAERDVIVFGDSYSAYAAGKCWRSSSRGRARRTRRRPTRSGSSTSSPAPATPLSPTSFRAYRRSCRRS